MEVPGFFSQAPDLHCSGEINQGYSCHPTHDDPSAIMSPSSQVQTTLPILRSQLLDQLLFLYAFFGILVIIVAQRVIVTDGWSVFAVMQLVGASQLVLTALARKRLSVSAKGHLLVLSFTILGVNSLLTAGIASRGTLLLILPCLIAFFALSRLEGLLSGALGVTLISIVGFLQSSGQIPIVSPTSNKLLDQSNWLNGAVFYGFMAVSLMIVLGRFQQLVESLLETEHETVAKLEAATREAERANAAKTDFLSRMSHELRTPLNAILGFTELLQVNPEGQREKRLDSIRVAGEHLLVLINEVLDLMGIEEGHLVLDKVNVDLGPIVDECIVLVSTRANASDITLRTAITQSPLQVSGDALRIKQILLNLLSNSVKYNQPQGSVSLLARTLDTQWIEIVISDTGIGIAPEDTNKVFQPFTRFGSRQINVEGTGVGLAISRQLVELMGGDIKFSSELGVGTTFTIRLPRT